MQQLGILLLCRKAERKCIGESFLQICCLGFGIYHGCHVSTKRHLLTKKKKKKKREKDVTSLA